MSPSSGIGENEEKKREAATPPSHPLMIPIREERNSHQPIKKEENKSPGKKSKPLETPTPFPKAKAEEDKKSIVASENVA